MSPSRIIFGSCNSQHQEQRLWPSIIARNASAFIWGGDAVYADSKRFGKELAATPEIAAESYQTLLNNSGYQELIEQNKTIVGVWDDHDFGVNNGDRTYEHKQAAADLFVKFLQESNKNIQATHKKYSWPLMEQRAKKNKGVYSVVVFDFEREGDPLLTDEEAGIDPEVNEGEVKPLSNKSVAIFLLDVRYNKTPWIKGYQHFAGDYEGDFLGEEQWQWFEQGLSRSTARVNLVVTGLQVHADRWFDGKLVEDWSRYPLAQHRLYQNLLRPDVNAPILVSGDVHMAEYLRRDCKRPIDITLKRQQEGEEDVERIEKQVSPIQSLVEVTTSGMTHSWGTFNCPWSGNSYACNSKYVQMMTATAMHIAHINHAWRNLIDMLEPKQEGAKRRVQYSLDLNFGEFEFDWEQEQVTVRIWGEDQNLNKKEGNQKPSRPHLSNTWEFARLSAGKELSFTSTGKLADEDFTKRYETMLAAAFKVGAPKSFAVSEDDWICLPNQGTMPPYVKVIGPLSALTISGCIFYLTPIMAPVLLILTLYRRWYPRKHKLD